MRNIVKPLLVVAIVVFAAAIISALYLGPNNKLEEKASETFEIKNQKQVDMDCSGTARCFSGIVTKITDGDTIDVDGKAIRFAVSSAPETFQKNGDAATDLIAQLCPVGSTAFVDEDDGQTQGSYGRIIGVVYCNGYNLNKELLDSGLGYVSAGFCNISEFAKQEWIQRHGCSFPEPSPVIKHDTQEKPVNNLCDLSYPDFCIPFDSPDLDCDEIPQRNFRVLQPDSHHFDNDNDGIGCEGY